MDGTGTLHSVLAALMGCVLYHQKFIYSVSLSFTENTKGKEKFAFV